MLTASMLAWLRCFEAAGRHRSISRAAAELCISQGAVSQQVKQLERALDRTLLVRGGRAMDLSPDGLRLQQAVHEAFHGVESALAQLRRPDGRPVALSCSPSFAMKWLTPRLSDFFRLHPGVHLAVRGEFHAIDQPRMARDELDAALRFDLGAYDGLYARKLLDEWLVPVASPAFLAAHPQLRSPADLRPEWLLHDASPWDGAGEFTEWNGWLAATGVTLDRLDSGPRFNLSLLSLEAAAAGQGVALGRTALVLDDLRSGRLVELFGRPVQSEASYFFVAAQEPSGPVVRVEAWLRARAEDFVRERQARWGAAAAVPADGAARRAPAASSRAVRRSASRP
ncbi:MULTISPECIES: LysR substrate-binding domain-containing protein [Ramlibacter]|uniref:LysR family transcriptional regulator n=1 Tax=Ramlibacter pinisoli TaxID=2682844 RepID=A0A6N8IVN5_9BURK|nr:MULTISPECIES: LysR substrate-binding domain-containing protein [Ramlibacter]MBA2965225.1 LysR family transcriptional regulator [Ramlibacter sp. CGMCC 1.13660]MVQ30190.1 LysR family transcriptional regulator [Ramlibacter pinisoli]